MKYIVILGDGMADYPAPLLDGKTPLEVAKKPNIDRLSREGEIGLVATVPKGLKPGSDVANLSVLGYPPEQYYTGRSPLEALSLGINLADGDIAVRCNLVTLSDAPDFDDKVMLDYSAGEISSEEAKELIFAVEQALGSDAVKFYPGVSYRHCLVVAGGTVVSELVPPHDISDQAIGGHLIKNDRTAFYFDLMRRSEAALKDHPVNRKRVAEGKRPATHIWLWGAGTRPTLPSFESLYGVKGAMISAVDLLKGIAVGAGMTVINVPGATGTLSTDFRGKAEAALAALDGGHDYVYLHIEAPDECGHQGDTAGKVLAIEKVDEVVGIVEQGLNAAGEAYVMLITPDHATPLVKKTHVSDPVPFVLYRSDAPGQCGKTYTEKNAEGGLFLNRGADLIQLMLKR